jgi:hypothetical protein
MKKIFIISVLMIYFDSVKLFSQSDTTFYPVFNSISSSLIKKHLNVLAHDSLEGRGVGTKGGSLAANYISDQFSKYGLTKITSDNSYFQNIPMHGSIPLNSSDLQLISKTDTILLNYFADYFLYRSGQQTFIPTPLPLVFVGYGIDAPEYDYNDYQSVDVEGKIVVYLDGEPYSEDEDYFAGEIPTVYSYSESKRRIAISHGVAGTIQIPLSYFDNWEAIEKEFEFEDVTLAYSVSSSLSILLNPTIADKLFRGAKYSFTNVIEMHNNKRIESFPLETKLKFKGVFKERDFVSQNIIGMVAGSDAELKNTYLIISAHYDHLGIGTAITGDSIYNGALDNAMGVSVLLELANTFSRLEVKPKRSILFIATTGEEEGLLGSSYYTDNPIVPLYKTIANVNIDGIAMFKDFESIVGIGTEFSTLESWLSLTAEKYKMSLQSIPPQFKSFDAFNKSDQLAFALAGVPSILVLEGTKNKFKTEGELLEAFINYYLEIYHTPFDDLNQHIDYKAAAKHAEILFDLCHILADDNDTPNWKPSTPFINARLRTIAEKR